MKIALMINCFPVLSETFILDQITDLLDRGYEVDIYAEGVFNTVKIHSKVVKYNIYEHIFYLGEPKNRLWRIVKAFKLLIYHLIRRNNWQNFLLILSTLNVFKYGKISASFTLFYATAHLLDKRPVYDIIHCHFAPNGIKTLILRELGLIEGRVITTFHGYDVNKNFMREYVQMYKHILCLGDLYTVNTTFTGNKAIELGCPPNKIFKLPVGIDISQYNFQKKVLHSNETIKILTVARLVEKKGIEYSIRAVAKVLKNYSNIEYKIIGEGYLRKSLEKLTTQLKITNKVKFLGGQTQDEIRQIYADSHIFILSSVTASDGDKEGQALVLQEAQAMGLPVLSTLHNGIPDGVLDGKSGFLVPEKDVNALADKLSYLVEHPETWSSMGLAGRLFVEKNYDINMLNDKLIEIYKMISDPNLICK
ncbi:glycosyltransferase [uncultured Nostoc sp.]|uniref:glycosyltransferase n=1 Tax=uncultured Nostoc sp. TaxID=340711 RepID=UPI0035CBF9F4